MIKLLQFIGSVGHKKEKSSQRSEVSFLPSFSEVNFYIALLKYLIGILAFNFFHGLVILYK